MLLDLKTIIQWNNSNKTHFISKGYKFTKIKDTLEILTNDLPIKSHQKVKVKCDYCNDVFEKEFRYVRPNQKDACKNCGKKKIEENNIAQYGIRHTIQRKEVREKIKETNLERYGVECNLAIEAVKQKIKETNLKKYGNVCSLHGENVIKKTKETWLKKYGVEHCLQSKEIRNKIKETNLIKYDNEVAINSKNFQEEIKKNNLQQYGVEYYIQSENFKNKTKETCLQRYGVDHPMKDAIIKEKATTTFVNNLYKNGKVACSKYQKHLHELLGGELNYPIGKCLVDIAFLDEEIYLEYNGGGHYIFDSIDNKRHKDKKRQYYLKTKGWKNITIISISNKQLSDGLIVKLIQEAKDYLKNTSHSWVEIDIDNMVIKCKDFKKEINV